MHQGHLGVVLVILLQLFIPFLIVFEDSCQPQNRQGLVSSLVLLQVAEFGRVAIVTKAAAEEGCTTYAQGGVCAVLDPLDSVDKHIQDTMVAGAHLNNLGYVLFSAVMTFGNLWIAAWVGSCKGDWIWTDAGGCTACFSCLSPILVLHLCDKHIYCA